MNVENENFDNQTEEATETNEYETQEPTDVHNNETQETSTPEEEEYDVIKYNKEEVKIPASERQTYLQKGYNYDKVQQQAEQLRQENAYLDKMAQMSGYTDRQEFIRAIEQAEEQQRIQRESSKMGVDEQTYKQFFQPVNQRLQVYETELQTLRLDKARQDVQARLSELSSKYEDFPQYQDKVFDLALTRGYDLEDAYRLASYEDRLASIGQQKEQEVLARVTGRDQKQVLASNDKPSNTSFNPANMSFDDIKSLSQRVQRGERITFT